MHTHLHTFMQGPFFSSLPNRLHVICHRDHAIIFFILLLWKKCSYFWLLKKQLPICFCCFFSFPIFVNDLHSFLWSTLHNLLIYFAFFSIFLSFFLLYYIFLLIKFVPLQGAWNVAMHQLLKRKTRKRRWVARWCPESKKWVGTKMRTGFSPRNPPPLPPGTGTELAACSLRWTVSPSCPRQTGWRNKGFTCVFRKAFRVVALSLFSSQAQTQWFKMTTKNVPVSPPCAKKNGRRWNKVIIIA